MLIFKYSDNIVSIICSAALYTSSDFTFRLIQLHLLAQMLKCSCYSDFRPNDGFLCQLELYRSMGCHVDLTFPAYRKYRLELLAEQMQKGILTESIKFCLFLCPRHPTVSVVKALCFLSVRCIHSFVYLSEHILLLQYPVM